MKLESRCFYANSMPYHQFLAGPSHCLCPFRHSVPRFCRLAAICPALSPGSPGNRQETAAKVPATEKIKYMSDSFLEHVHSDMLYFCSKIRPCNAILQDFTLRNLIQ